jgi:5'-nucleotidase
LILVTNDDGDSQGLRVLLDASKEFGESCVLAPNKQRSAVSRALTLHKPIRIHKINDEIFTINGTPADCVLFSIYSGEFQKPDLILSGINWGENACLGPLLGSGTVGACWQAALEGIPSIALSIHRDHYDWRDPDNWGDPGKLKETIVRIVRELRPKLGPKKFFNVNLPEDHENAKIVYTNQLQAKKYRTVIEKRVDPNKVPYYWITGEAETVKNGTDLYEIIVKKNITVTEISLTNFQHK